jgi:hypothetical protein
MSFKNKGLKITFKPELMPEVGAAALEVIKGQCAQGLSSEGESLNVDWHKSGALLDTARVNEAGGVEFTVPYAKVLNARYTFAGVAPQMVPVYESKLAPLIRDGLIFKEEV